MADGLKVCTEGTPSCKRKESTASTRCNVAIHLQGGIEMVEHNGTKQSAKLSP